MNDKVEWEVVDNEEGRRRNDGHEAYGNQPPPRAPNPQEVLKAMLGPWWRWKLAAIFTIGGIALIIVATVAGILVVTGLAFALLALAIVKLRAWWRGSSNLPDRYR